MGDPIRLADTLGDAGQQFEREKKRAVIDRARNNRVNVSPTRSLSSGRQAANPGKGPRAARRPRPSETNFRGVGAPRVQFERGGRRLKSGASGLHTALTGTQII